MNEDTARDDDYDDRIEGSSNKQGTKAQKLFDLVWYGLACFCDNVASLEQKAPDYGAGIKGSFRSFGLLTPLVCEEHNERISEDRIIE